MLLLHPAHVCTLLSTLSCAGPSFCCNVQYDANYSDAALMQRGSNCTASGDRRMARSAKLSKLLM